MLIAGIGDGGQGLDVVRHAVGIGINIGLPDGAGAGNIIVNQRMTAWQPVLVLRGRPRSILNAERGHKPAIETIPIAMVIQNGRGPALFRDRQF